MNNHRSDILNHEKILSVIKELEQTTAITQRKLIWKICGSGAIYRTYKEVTMVIEADASRCPLCGGTKKSGKTTFTADLGFGVVVVRDAPAAVCSQCGADWIGDAVAVKLEEIVSDARKKHHMVEITTMGAI